MNREAWNNLVKDNAPAFGTFLHSWEWGEFQKRVGNRIQRIDHVDEHGRTIAQAIRYRLPFAQGYWFVPKGPLGGAPLEKQVAILRNELVGGVFLRIEPGREATLMQFPSVQPSTTWCVDLKKDEEQLLAEMKSKTRYNIRLAARKGVECKIVDLESFDDFVRLMDQTTTRDGFSAHPSAYYRALVESINSPDARAFLAIASYDGRPLAANIMIDFAGTRTYLHGASSNLHRNVMAPYALHWFLMKDAKEHGMEEFDFWGIAPEGADDTHAWKGITRYKKGFGGFEKEMPGTYELPMKHLWYSTYRFAKKLRSIRGK